MTDIVNKEMNIMYIYLQKEIYDINIIFKSLYNFIDKFYIKLESENDKIKIIFQAKNDSSIDDLYKYKGEFYNELLKQQVRYKLVSETKDIRELIMGRALYDTCIEYIDDTINDEENYAEVDDKIDDPLNIMSNWFENKED